MAKFVKASMFVSNWSLSSLRAVQVATPGNKNPFPNDKIYTLSNSKSLQTTISNLMKMAESSQNQ